MKIKEFISSGVLEQYCNGSLNSEEEAFVIQMALLYPAVKVELTQIELFIESFAKINAVEVSNPRIKQNILTAIVKSFKYDLDINNLPIIDKNTDYRLWLKALKHLMPAKPKGDMIFEVLRHDEKVTQSLVISKIDVPEETHQDVLESILVLKGECECTIGDNIFKAGPGYLIEIPLYVEHNIKVVTPYVTAVLQHLAF